MLCDGELWVKGLEDYRVENLMVFNELEFHILLGWDRGQGYYLCAYVIYVSLDRLFFDGEFWEDSEQGMDLLGVL